MNQNKVNIVNNTDESSFAVYRANIQKYFSERELSQADIDVLNSMNHKIFFKKQLCKEEFLYWLIQCDVLFSYEIKDYFQQKQFHIEEPLWTPPHLRLNQSRQSIFKKHIFNIAIGGNTAATDWKEYDYNDYYNPDFKIYNDVTIRHFDSKYELWNYPEEQFPPVYAHDTVHDKNIDFVYITGGLGSGDRQRKNITEIYQLNLETKDIEHIEALGDSPPCLHNHHTKMWNDDLIEMRDGDILKNGKAIKNLYVWYFNLKTKTWLKKDQEIYQHWLITSSNSDGLFLDISKEILKMEDEKNYSVELIEERKQDIFKFYGYIPDYKIYLNLYRPVKEMYFSEVTGYIDRYSSYVCILNGQVYHCFEGYNRIEVAFQSSASNEFQKFIINDLKVKLKKMTGFDVCAEKIA